MKQAKLLGWLSAIILAFFLSACQNADNKGNKSAEADQPYTVTDDTGKEVTFEKAPKTVVSLEPSNTEILFALDSGDKVIGATDLDHYPEEAKEIERVSDSVHINTEKIIDLDPGVVFASTTADEGALKTLEDAEIPVFVIQSASSFEDVFGDIEQISEVMNVKEKGETLIKDIQSQIAEVEKKVKTIENPKTVYVEMIPAPEMYTVGKNTLQDMILQKAGVKNTFGDQVGLINVTAEEVAKQNPEIIVTTGLHENPVTEIQERKGWENINAIQNDEVYLVDNDLMGSSGPRIGEAVELVAKTAYPELFQ
ncbi:ABC transporter substrate-binding protein [Siminovitchia sp. FSL W7-1587]|uniref:ABC transporter substrate-binding protein n=1 Tax=Siminovitchia sp. FSL W7-1587 TaxID=2954699 RepID=UPI0030CEA7DA